MPTPPPPPNPDLATELSLLEAIYPSSLRYDSTRSELTFHTPDGTLILRLPQNYPSSALPELISAHGPAGIDLRDGMQTRLKQLSPGDALLDILIANFEELVSQQHQITDQAEETSEVKATEASATVVIWLHHLLNTAKRKTVLSPADAQIRGLSKPGYPGVIVYSGPAEAVREQVALLKGLNWQAFQVRLEGDVSWEFEHARGVKEVENMAELVHAVRQPWREELMDALKIR